MNYTMIGSVRGFGAGMSSGNLSYQFTDNEICTGIVYYKLKQIDVNGTYAYSNVISVNCKSSMLNLSPNPTTKNVVLNFYEHSDGHVTVEVADMIGQIVLRKHYDVHSGFNDLEVEAGTLPDGVYYLKVMNADPLPGDVAKQIKFLKY